MISPYTFSPRGRLLHFMRQAGNPSLINLAAGLPSSECVPKNDLKRAFETALTESADQALGYQTPDGDYLLRELLAKRFGARGINVTADEMVITTGCTQALHGTIRLLAKAGDVVACEAPAYYATLEILGDLGVKVLPVPVRDANGVDLDLASSLFNRYRPRCFVVCSTLSNPSGATMPNRARLELLNICRRTETRIIEDEIYGELTEIVGLRPIRSFDDGSTVSYVTSFSKTVAPGLRIGVCIPGGNTDAFALLKSQQDMHSATICEVAFRKYLELGVLDTHLDYVRTLNRERRELAYHVLQESFPSNTKVWEPQGGFMLWVELAATAELGTLYRAALAESVAFCQGTAFFTADSAGTPAMRLNCSCPSKEQLTEGLQILAKLLCR